MSQYSSAYFQGLNTLGPANKHILPLSLVKTYTWPNLRPPNLNQHAQHQVQQENEPPPPDWFQMRLSQSIHQVKDQVNKQETLITQDCRLIPTIQIGRPGPTKDSWAVEIIWSLFKIFLFKKKKNVIE